MVKLQLLSQDLILIINQILNNQQIAKYLTYRNNNPLSQPNIVLPATSLMFKNIEPYPFDTVSTVDDNTQIRVYFPIGNFNDREVITDISLYFDIICAKTLWLVNDGTPLIRPYEIMKLIVGLFSNKDIGTVGKIQFNRFAHLSVNERFNAIRIDARFMQIGTS